jgi:hypothetical protein
MRALSSGLASRSHRYRSQFGAADDYRAIEIILTSNDAELAAAPRVGRRGWPQEVQGRLAKLETVPLKKAV